MTSDEMSAKVTEWFNSGIESFSSLTYRDIGKLTIWAIGIFIVVGTYEFLQKYLKERPQLVSHCHRVEDIVLRLAYVAMGIVATVMVFKNID